MASLEAKAQLHPWYRRPLWLEIASAIDKAAATDKQAKTLLQADPRWTEVSEQLAPMRERLLPEHPSLLWTCGAPPARQVYAHPLVMRELAKQKALAMVPATALARVPLLWATALGGWQRRV